MAGPLETDLYAPIKTFLEGQGYEVKGEIGAADVVACRADEDPVIVELKTTFSLSLVHQGIERQAVTDAVYLAVPHKTGRKAASAVKENSALCRRLGLGLISVRLRDGFVEVLVDPGPYHPRKSTVRKSKLLREFQRRVGDPTQGGSTRKGLVTAYRQDALRVAAFLSENGPTKGSEVAKATNVPKATSIMSSDHYGWFERVNTGIYMVTPKGHEGLKTYGWPSGAQSG